MLCHFCGLALIVFQQRARGALPPPSSNFSKRILANWKIELWENWGGQVHPSPPRGDATEPKVRLVVR